MSQDQSFLYQEIAESIRRLITSGELEPGARLPSVRRMAERWECTPNTVSRAYDVLAQQGLIARHQGRGTQVASTDLHPDDPVWDWASLVNQAEQYLLSAIRSGHTTNQAQTALAVAAARWRDLQAPPLPAAGQPADESTTVRFVGSHDLTIASLARLAQDAEPAITLTVEYAGSLAGLMALAQGEADLAGIHLWDQAADDYNIPFVRRLLPGRRVSLVTLAGRSLGLMLPPGNPQQVAGLADLARPEVRLVNRQRGSGTRVWLDAQLRDLDLQRESIEGYGRELLTHIAVARAVADSEATVGLGIYAAAIAYGLDFVPLTQERYELACPRAVRERSSVQALVEIVQSPRFRQAVSGFGGYDTSLTGQERWIT